MLQTLRNSVLPSLSAACSDVSSNQFAPFRLSVEKKSGSFVWFSNGRSLLVFLLHVVCFVFSSVSKGIGASIFSMSNGGRSIFLRNIGRNKVRYMM
jgi:hypothetical protein